VRPFRQARSEIPLDAARKFLNNDETLFTFLQSRNFQRSLPKIEALQQNPEVTKLLRNVLVEGRSVDKPEENSSLNFCYKMGWLQAELVDQGELEPEEGEATNAEAGSKILASKKTVYVFPTRIHQRCDHFNVYGCCR
jgi:hypothetical protein